MAPKHKQDPSKYVDTANMAYSNCTTRIIPLSHLNLPTSRTTTEENYREIYSKYILDPANAPTSDYLQSAIISLTTGIAPPVAFPTETVYGLGADATNAPSIAGIFAAKGRPSDNPLIVHVSSINQLERLYGCRKGESVIPEVYRDLVTHFWPGPLTVLLAIPENSPFATNVHPGQKTIGFRMPSSPAARFLISVTDRPIAAPSANSSGKPSPTTAKHVFDDLNGKINFILDDGPCNVGVESTVVDGLGEGGPVILRPGGVSRKMLREFGEGQPIGSAARVWANVENAWEMKKSVAAKEGCKDLSTGQGQPHLNGVIFDKDGHDLRIAGDEPAPRAPGMKYKHYSPTAPMYLFESPRSGTAISPTSRQKQQDSPAANAILKAIYTHIAAQHQQPTKLKLGVLPSTEWVAFAGLDCTASTSNSTTTTSTTTTAINSQPAFHNAHILDWDTAKPAPEAKRGKETSLTIQALHASILLTEDCAPLELGIFSLPLGTSPAVIASRLFAVLRKCDELGCDLIVAQAPRFARVEAGDEGVDEEFETVLERMRKAASEIIEI